MGWGCGVRVTHQGGPHATGGGWGGGGGVRVHQGGVGGVRIYTHTFCYNFHHKATKMKGGDPEIQEDFLDAVNQHIDQHNRVVPDSFGSILRKS